MGIIVYLDSAENFDEYINLIMSRKLVTSNSNANGKWIIITPPSNITKYFLTLWKGGVINLVVLLYKDKTYARLYTSDPQDILNDCGDVLNSVTEQICDSNISIQFPKPRRKYTNCGIKYYGIHDYETDTQLGYVVTNFVKKLVTLHLNSSHNRADVDYKHFVHVGPLRYVAPSNPSTIFFSPKVIWAVPKPKLIPLIEVVKIIFKKTVWGLMAFSFLLVTIIWWLIAKYLSKCIDDRCDFTLVLLNVWESTILGCVNRVPVIWSLRFVFISYIVYSIHIQAIINSKVVELLTIPQYEPGIRNLEELSESNLHIIILKLTKQVMFDYNRNENNRSFNKIYKLFRVIEFKKVAETFFDCVTKNLCAAMFTGEEPFVNKTFFEISDVIEDNSVTGNIDYVLYVDCHYMYLTLNKVVYSLVESGIIDQFIRKKMIERNEYFLKLWRVGVINFVVLLSNKNNSYARLYNGDPQDILNNCGEALNTVTEQFCDSDISFQFPKHRRKYINCAIKYYGFYEYQTDTQLGYVVTTFVKNLVTQHLNSSHNKADLEYKHFVHFDFLRYVVPSNPSTVFFSPKVMWAVPKPKLIPLIKVIKIIFKKTVWALMIFSFLLVSIIWWLIAKYVSKCIDDQCDFILVLLNVWESTIMGCANRVPVIWSLRFIFISYIVYSIHIQAIINSKVVELLTIPQYEPGIRNLEELSESNLQIIVLKQIKVTMFDYKRIESNRSLDKIHTLLRVIEFNKVAETFFDCVTKNLCAAVFTGDEPFLNKTFFEISDVIEDNSLTGNIDYVLHIDCLNYIYLTLNKVIYTLVESGIIDRFVREKMSERNGKISSETPDPVPLAVDNVYIIFIFWGAGILLSLFIFFAEFLAAKLICIQNYLKNVFW
ncbi:hypothetical protein FQR65_LT11596 [Abscondita terminalis]|nr:hypothetical protein FQR65_LT11596 [Abscondita terminalis]